ncbi:MAG: hypothetical protein AAFO74_12500 [Pseudomonadota bacterium]
MTTASSLACLIVHKVSVPYIRNVIETIQETLEAVYGPETKLHICDDVDEVETGEAQVIFVIGEQLKRFTRRPGKSYVYFNFSVVAMIGNYLRNSLKGAQLIRYKRKLLDAKLDLFDAVIDYYPSQTQALKRKLDLPVAGFVPWVKPCSGDQIVTPAQREFDVCFVGGMSPRRSKVIESLKASGLSISPSSGVDLDDVARRSRCTLNIHMQRSNHLEIPRVMASLANASPLITENSHGIFEILPDDLVIAAPYGHLIEATKDALTDQSKINDIADLAHRWYAQTGVPSFRAKLVNALQELNVHPKDII